VHEVVKGGTNNAACFVDIIQARCQTAEMITSRVPFQDKLFVFLSRLLLNQPYTSRLVLPHRAQFFALIALTKECDGQTVD
jgi:hypothetical protein